MLDLKYIRENAEAVQENSRNRGVEADVGLVVELADRRSALIQELNEPDSARTRWRRASGRSRTRVPGQAHRRVARDEGPHPREGG